MPLTKTQRAILADARRNAAGVVMVRHGMVTNRTRPHYGVRRHDAAAELWGIGWLEPVRVERNARPMAHGRGEDHYTIVTFRLTKSGRAAAL